MPCQDEILDQYFTDFFLNQFFAQHGKQKTFYIQGTSDCCTYVFGQRHRACGGFC